MGRAAPLSPEYECRILNRALRAVRTFLLVCETDQEAQQAANEVFLRQEGVAWQVLKS